jgi:chromosomal replication initiation ATPase DnaA
MTTYEDTLKQLPLEFAQHSKMGRDDFMVSDCNRTAFKLIDSWPNWYGSGLFIYGPQGYGKTHLA